jgi:FkbM family methyltransferase
MILNRLKYFVKSKLNNSLVTKAKLLADLFLSYRKECYSQYGEDQFLREYFKDKSSGFYVDVGAFHPRQFSNTYNLYKRGWRGVNIDATLHSMKLFGVFRPEDINLQTAVSIDGREIVFSSWGLNSENTCVPAQAEGVAKQFDKSPTQTRMKSQRLVDIFQQHLNKDQTIDLLSVDVEGMDLEVLKSNDWVKYAPELVMVETFANSIEDVQKEEVYSYLVGLGYSMVSWYYRTLVFKKCR